MRNMLNSPGFIGALTIMAVSVLVPGHTHAKTAGGSLIDTDARWVLRLDLDTFRNTTIGKHLEAMSHDHGVPGVPSGMRIKLNEAARLVDDVTAYGDGSDSGPGKEGVLVLRGEARMSQILEAILINEEQTQENFAVETVQTQPYALYLVKHDTYVAFHSPSLVVASKSRVRLDRAREVLDGRRPGMHPEAIPGGIRPSSEGFFFFGGAEGFGRNDAIPAKAAVLRMAEQGRVTIGETGENFRLVIELLTKDDSVAQRLQKVIQGMIALLSLTAVDAVDFEQLTSETVVETAGRLVTIRFGFPVGQLVDMLEKRRDADETVASADRAI